MARVITVLVALLAVTACLAQNPFTVSLQMTEIYLLTTSGPPAQPLVLDAPTTAGAAPVTATSPDPKTYLRYTSTVSSGKTRRVQAQTTALPAGTKLEVSVSPATAGAGNRGSTVAGTWVELKLTANDVLTGVGGCYSGTVATGADITYRLSAGDMSQLKAAAATPITVTFTLTAES